MGPEHRLPDQSRWDAVRGEECKAWMMKSYTRGRCRAPGRFRNEYVHSASARWFCPSGFSREKISQSYRKARDVGEKRKRETKGPEGCQRLQGTRHGGQNKVGRFDPVIISAVESGCGFTISFPSSLVQPIPRHRVTMSTRDDAAIASIRLHSVR